MAASPVVASTSHGNARDKCGVKMWNKNAADQSNVRSTIWCENTTSRRHTGTPQNRAPMASGGHRGMEIDDSAAKGVFNGELQNC